MTDTNTLGSAPAAPVPPEPAMVAESSKRSDLPKPLNLPVGPDGLPEVELPRDGRKLSEFALDVGAVMARNGVFLQDGEPVVLQPFTDRMEPLTPACFRTYAEKNLTTVKSVTRKVTKTDQNGASYEAKEPMWLPSSMNKMQAEAVLTSHHFRSQQRPLRRISRIPVPIFRDGQLALHECGYHQETKILVKSENDTAQSVFLQRISEGVHTEINHPLNVSIRYDLMPKEAAVDYLRDLLHEFPFADDSGRSLACQVAAMVTRFAVSLLPEQAQVPLVIWSANGPAAGKSLLAMIVEIPVRGFCAMRSLPEEKEELEKVLSSEVLAGSDSIIFDNVKERLDSGFLEQFATSSVVSVRRLGSSAKYEVAKQTMIMFTSNQAEVSSDIARRSIFIDLFNREADPQARKIERPMGAEYLARPEVRFKILSALWSLIHAWDAAGRPPCSSRLVGFEDWSRIIAGIVEYAGFGNPLAKVESEDFGDPEAADMRDLVKIMAEGIYRDGFEIKTREGIPFDEVIWICRDRGLFSDAIQGKTDRETKEFEMFSKSRSRMGKLLARYANRVFRFEGDLGTVKLERVGPKNSRVWRVS